MVEAVVDMNGTHNKGGDVNSSSQLADDILIEGGRVPLDVKQAFLLPAWYDERKFRRGQKFFHENFFALFVAKLCGLVLVLAVPTILRVLIITKKSSTPITAFHRYLDTISHMLEWYDGDLHNPNSRASKSLLNIRGRHCNATSKAKKSGYNNISQRDMALTQFGFMGLAILSPKELGITGSEKDFDGFIHFWRVVGYLLGIKDKYNLCQGDLQTTKEVCQAMLNREFNTLITNPSAEFNYMCRAMLEGMWAINPFINTEATLAFTKFLCGVDYTPLSNFYSRALLNMQIYVHSVLLNSFLSIILRPILNFNMWFSVFIAQRIPYLAFLAFGREIATPQQYTIETPLVVGQ